MKIKIREGLEIGDSCPPFIIAEVGSNWQTLDDCIHSVRCAKECGADAVKFQAFNYEALYGVVPDYAAVISIDPDLRIYNSLKDLPISWLPKLKEQADLCEIEFMCSAFSPELIDVVDPFVNIHKLASAEMCHVRMLEKLRSIGKPVFMSTGAHTVEEIGYALAILHDVDLDSKSPPPIVLMYCVAAYPAKEIHLDVIPHYRSDFGCLAGYSDHSTDVLVIPKAANMAGACVLEKHFTAIPDLKSPDREHSLTPTQFKNMVESVRKGSEAYSKTPGPTLDESPMLLRHNRRLLATTDIGVGDTLQEGVNFGIYRALKDMPDALSPFKIDDVKGMYALKEIKAGDGISEDTIGR